MNCGRIEGNDYQPGRLLFDDAGDAVEDAIIELQAPDAQGNFDGIFRDPHSGATLPDHLVEGHCTTVNQRDQITFTRQHADGHTTTQYQGRVTLLQGTTTVMLRGRFTRTTITPASPVTTMSGDYETEKPT